MASFEQPELPVHRFPDWKAHFLNGSRNWVNGDMKWEQNKDFDNVSLPYGCARCKRGNLCGVELYPCKQCNVAHYCSETCRDEDYGFHKALCMSSKQYYDVIVNAGGTLVAAHDRESYQAFLTEALLKFQLAGGSDDETSSELRVQQLGSSWECQQHCQACFKTPFVCRQDPARREGKPTAGKSLGPSGSFLEVCSGCHSVARCRSPQCEARFKKLHTSADCERYLEFYASKVLSMQFGSSPIMNSNSRVEAAFYQARSLVSNWTEYFALKMESFDLPTGLMQLPPVMAYPLQELLALESVEVHVLGAEYAEANGALDKYEEVLHWLPNCRALTILLCGPCIREETSFVTEDLCESCTAVGDVECSDVGEDGSVCHAAGLRLTIHEVRGMYHDLVAASEELEAAASTIESGSVASKKRKFIGSDEEEDEEEDEVPFPVLVENATLLVCFHSGLHDTVSSSKFQTCLNTSWKATVDLISASGKPCVFTGYTSEEMAADAEALRSWGSNITVPPRENSFRGLLAYPEVSADNEFYYSNHSCLMVQGRVETD